MTRKDTQPVGLADLEAALDTYGADRTRWPAPLRHSLCALITSNADAKKMLDDALLFDRLLDSAPSYDGARVAALADRIAVAAARQPRVIATSPVERVPFVKPRRDYGYAGAALAASLLLGVLVGQSNMVSRTVQPLVAEESSTYDPSVPQLAFTDEADTLLDEDLL